MGYKVRVVKFLHDVYLASASNDVKLRIWDLKNGVCVRTLVDSDEQASKMYFFSIDILDHELLVSGSRSKSISYVIVWNYINGKQINKYKFTKPVEKIEVIQKDFLVIAENNLVLWNLTNDKTETLLLANKSRAMIKYNNEIIIVATSTNISVWNISNRSLIDSSLTTIEIEYLVYINPTFFAIGSLNNDVEIWMIDSLKLILSKYSNLQKSKNELKSLLPLNDKNLARGTKTNIEIWDFISNTLITSYAHQSGADYLTLKKLPDERIVNGGNIKLFKIFNQTDKSDYQLKEHSAGVKSFEVIENLGISILR